MEVIRLLSSQHVFLASLTLLSYCINMTATYMLKLGVVTFAISIFTEELFFYEEFLALLAVWL